MANSHPFRKGGQTLLAIGDENKQIEAQEMLDEAVQIYLDVNSKFTDEPSMTDD